MTQRTLLLLTLGSFLSSGFSHAYFETPTEYVDDMKKVVNGTVTSLLRISQTRQLRDIPDGMLDPYSVLGVMSFGVYIFYILYSRYRMKGSHAAPAGGAGGAAQLFSGDTQDNIASILKMATKIIAQAPYLSISNTTLDGDDYFDAADSSDLRSKQKPSRK